SGQCQVKPLVEKDLASPDTHRPPAARGEQVFPLVVHCRGRRCRSTCQVPCQVRSWRCWANTTQMEVVQLAQVDVTQLFPVPGNPISNEPGVPLSRCPSLKGSGSLQPPIPGSGTPSPRNRRRAILRAGRVCFGSALHWWLGLLRVFPVCNSEPGS